jgi:UTP--glucose-1-phosphate uridylyltransferase
MIAAGHAAFGFRLGPAEARQDVGNFESYFRAFLEAALADEQYGPAVREQLQTRLAALP